MVFLKCTRAVLRRARLKKEHLCAATSSDALLGNWYVTLARIEGRNAFIYMSERSLLTFLMLEGERIDPQKLSGVLHFGLGQTLSFDSVPRADMARAQADCAAGMFTAADDLSLLGTLTNLVEDYRFFIENDGGLNRCNISAIVRDINSKPHRRLGFQTPYQVTGQLLQSVAT